MSYTPSTFVNTFLYRQPAGIPGTISRTPEKANVETQTLDPTHPPTSYGLGGYIDATSGDFRVALSGDSTTLYGVLVRPFPTEDFSSPSSPFGPGVPGIGPGGILRKGYISVQLNGTTQSTNNGSVYIRIANASAGKPLYGFEAAADGSNTIGPLVNAFFTGPADAVPGNAEICVNAG